MNHDEFQQTMELMKYYEAEFEYRHTHVWKVLYKFFTLITVLSLMPFVKGIAGITFADDLRKSRYIFPIIGFVMTIFSFVVLYSECKRLRYVNKIKYRINKKLPSICRYYSSTKKKRISRMTKHQWHSIYALLYQWQN